MEVTRGLFPKLLIGTFVVAVLGFMIRGFGQLAFGTQTARRLSIPVFSLGILMATVAFVLSVLVKAGLLGTENTHEESASD
jgi:hypothetical protein